MVIELYLTCSIWIESGSGVGGWVGRGQFVPTKMEVGGQGQLSLQKMKGAVVPTKVFKTAQ